MGTDHLTHDGPVRTDLDCHACGKVFVAELDYSLSGNHRIECPVCRHVHFRVITNGKVTGDRHDSDYGGRKDHLPLRVWSDSVLPARTSMASEFLRQKWLERLT